MEGFRKNTAETLRNTTKENRREKLAEVQRTDEYWTERVKKLVSQGQKAEWTPDRTGLHWKVKNLYHGTDVENISDFNYAEESTIGDNAVYFTTDAPLAMGYAKLRNRERKTDRTFLYEAVISDAKIMNWAETPIVEKLKNEYADYCAELRQEIQELGFENFSKKHGLPETITQSMAQLGLKRIIETCEQEGLLHGGNIKTVAQGVMGMFFERFVKSKGYDGVITVEGGDDPELTAKAGISVVIFNKEKIISNRAVDITVKTSDSPDTPEKENVQKEKQIPEFAEHETSPTLKEEAVKVLREQWEKFWQLRFATRESAISPESAQNPALLKDGVLLHNLRYDEVALSKILQSGVLSGELGYGEKESRAEDAETHYCADFFVNQGDKSVAQFIEFAYGNEENTGALRKKRIEAYACPREQNDYITIVVNPSRPELAELLQHSATGIETSRLANFPVRFPYGAEKPDIARRHLAVLVGIPANYISSLVVGRKLAGDQEKLAKLKSLVANSGLDITILNHKGERI